MFPGGISGSDRPERFGNPASVVMTKEHADRHLDHLTALISALVLAACGATDVAHRRELRPDRVDL
ncbi:hypothetical protein BA895_08590 [Humibacillus sp. DSM 29435]|nr:hypothetical protein BA895_08590 [Humibacillus sp. DSM 29435]